VGEVGQNGERSLPVCEIGEKVTIDPVDHFLIEVVGDDDSCTYHAIIKLVICFLDKR